MSCNTHWNSVAPSGCSTGSGAVALPLSPGSEDTTAASAVDTSIPQSFQPAPGTQPHPLPSHPRNVGSFPQHMHLFLLDRCFISAIPAPADLCHLLSSISCSSGSDAHSSWAFLKDTARPAGNCCSPRGNQGRPRAFTSGIYFPYTLNQTYVLKTPTSLTLSLFLFKYFAIGKMSDWYKSRNKLHPQMHCCYCECLENFLPKI